MKIFKDFIRFVFKLNLFISSYIPLFAIILIQEMDDLTCESVIKAYNKNNIFWIWVFVLSIFSLASLVVFFNGNHTTKKTFKDVKSINNDVLNYFITYIIPLNTIDIAEVTSILINIIIFGIIAIYYIESNLLYLNILLMFMGYKVFEDSNGNIIISRKDIDFLRTKKDILCKKIGNTKIYIVR